MTDNKWLVCRQTAYNAVKYQTSDGDTKYPDYRKFLDMMMEYNVRDPYNFKKNIDSFKPMFVNLQTGGWEILKIEKDRDISFDELYQLNENQEEIEKSKNKMLNMIDKGKKFIFKPQDKKWKNFQI